MISDTLHRRLTIVNSVLLGLFALALLIGVIVGFALNQGSDFIRRWVEARKQKDALLFRTEVETSDLADLSRSLVGGRRNARRA